MRHGEEVRVGGSEMGCGDDARVGEPATVRGDDARALTLSLDTTEASSSSDKEVGVSRRRLTEILCSGQTSSHVQVRAEPGARSATG